MFHLFEKINNNEVYIIAEMSANHGGSLRNALRIVHEVKEAGADCLKIQTYTADSLTIDSNRPEFQIHGGLWDGYNLYQLYTEASTPYEWQPVIKAECDKVGIDFLSTPFDRKAVDFLEGIGVEAYKIASYELVDIPLIEYTASKHKPMIISCGMGTVEEIQEAIEACYQVNNKQVVLLKCCSEYPSHWDNMNLMTIPDMKQRFNVPIGLSDHSAGSLGAVVGVALGASVIEKHVKLDGVNSVDSGFSMTTEEFKQMVKDVKATNLVKGHVFYGLTPGEGDGSGRRSLYAVKDIRKGEVFTEENVRSIRPGWGLKPKFYKEIIGKKATRDISFGEPLTADCVGEIKV